MTERTSQRASFQRASFAAAARFAAVAVLATALAAPALAEKPAHAGKPDHAGQGAGKGDGGKPHKGPSGRGDGGRDGGGGLSIEIGVVFDGDARDRVQSYYRTGFAGQDCPPGLAKKHNGCLPPGQAKRRFPPGSVVPDTIVLYPLPRELEIRLRPLPSGYVYRYADREVLVVAEAARKVIDAVVLLSTL